MVVAIRERVANSVVTTMLKMPAWSVKGMIVSEHPLATLAGWQILRQGGNFADAAVAVGATLAVVTPHLCGLGGDFFGLTWLAKEQTALAFNGSGRAPKNLSAADLRRRGLRTMPTYSALSVTVPGLVDALWQLHQRFGQLNWASLWQFAIAVAEEGFVVSPKLAHAIATNADRLAQDEGCRAVFFCDGKPLTAGQRLCQPALAQTLQRIAAEGRDGFYVGETAQKLATHLQRFGSPMTPNDFATYCGEWTQPISLRYRHATLLELPPNSLGIATLQTMALLQSLPVNRWKAAELVAHVATIAALVAEERDAYLADPDFVPHPPAALLSHEHLERLRQRLSQPPLRLTSSDGDTTNFVIVDTDGNALSAIQSLFHAFGSGILEPQTGVLFQNRGANFVLTEGHPNELMGGKRPRHTLSALLVLDERGEVKGLLGTSGGDFRPTIHAWILLRWLDFGMSLQAAIEAPRALWLGGRTLLVEQGLTDPTELFSLGWQPQLVPYPGGTGVAHGIERVGKSWCGCADLRGDGVALPL